MPVPVTGELVPTVLVPGEVVLTPVDDVLEAGEVLVAAAHLVINVLAPGRVVIGVGEVLVDGDGIAVGVGEDSRIRLLGEVRSFLFRFLVFELS